MAEAAVVAFLTALIALFPPVEPAVDPGAATIRIKSARICLEAVNSGAVPAQSPEPNPLVWAPSGDPTADRAWLIRVGITSASLKVLSSSPGQIDVRIFR